MNISDSERVISTLERMGFEWTDNESEAHLLGIVACSVRQKAIDKVYSRIYKWNEWKKSKSLITFLTGCVLPADREKFIKQFDLVFPMAELVKLPEMILQYGVISPMAINMTSSKSVYDINNLNAFWDISPRYQSKFEAFIPIQNGCDKFCTFCAVPYTRGREVSRPSGEIISEVRELIFSGYKSITLLGQNVNSYGLDKKGEEISFAQLLKSIGELGNNCGKEFWIYFTSPHPKDMTFEVIDTIAGYKVLAKQIQLPLQSGDEKVLIHMNRKHRLDEYRTIVDYIREKLPTATLFTDIIVGFTGESEEQFLNTQKAMEEFQFNMAFISPYSPRPGAVSARWEDNVPHQIKKERFHLLTQVLEKSSLRYNQSLVGKTLRILVTGMDRKGEFLSGLTEGRLNVRINSNNRALIGNFIDGTIHVANEFSLTGELAYIEALKV